MYSPRHLILLARVRGLADWPHSLLPFAMLADAVRRRRRDAVLLRQFRKTPKAQRSAELCVEATFVLRQHRAFREHLASELHEMKRIVRPDAAAVLGTPPPEGDERDWSVVFAYLSTGTLGVRNSNRLRCGD